MSLVPPPTPNPTSMKHTGWYAVVFAPAVVVAVAAWPSSVLPRVEGTPTEAPAVAAAERVGGRAVGQSGCASAGCHGALAGTALRDGPNAMSWKAAAILWSAADPHRRAYAVLESDLATRMMASLARGTSEPAKKATADARCLACHTNPTLALAEKDEEIAMRAEGVSCEACHGNASGWLTSHTGFGGARNEADRAGRDRADVTAKQYASAGMPKLYDLGERAVACAGCHVGAPADKDRGLPVRDMNHDMIAAGHPRLNFDFATYQFMLPKHWYERDRSKAGSKPDSNFEARAWLVGRVAHAEAACKLTADRAERANPWPEFAESSCVACHHTLAGAKTTYPKPTGGRALGSLPWQPIWPVTRPDDLSKLDPLNGMQKASDAVKLVQKHMQRSRPDAKTHDSAAAATEELKVLRGRLAAMSNDAAVTMVGNALTQAGTIPDAEWDRDLTEQVYHARAALERTRGDKADTAHFAAVAKDLTLPRGTVQFGLPPGAAGRVRDLLK